MPRIQRLAVVWLLLVSTVSAAQVFVYPRRAQQSQVRFFDFEWQTRELEIPLEGGQKGQVKLFFYRKAWPIAERAAAVLTQEYQRLSSQFHYTPSRSFPYILYSSYQEFLQTNLFPVQEGVLGVTSPRDLVLTLPYLGDDRLFKEVSSHEMAHQFTIQKVQDLARAAKVPGDPLEALPLWFIEGVAEFYAKEGKDPEAEMNLRDLVINPDPQRGYALIGFFEDRPGSVLWTYRAGNVRCIFLEEEYGQGFLQRVLEASVKLLARVDKGGVRSFPALLERLTGDAPEVTARKFEAWLKGRAFRNYLQAQDDTTRMRRLSDQQMREPFSGIVVALATSPSGNLIAVRSINPETGQSELALTDRRSPGDARTVASDGVPGIESLHPIAERNFALTDDTLAFFAETRAHDVLYLQPIESRIIERQLHLDGGTPESQVSVKLSVGSREAVDLAGFGLLAAYSPAFSPDGKQLAFVAISEVGIRDVYTYDLAERRLTQLTDDLFSEREVSWGPDGVVYSSNATAHGFYNLFRVKPGQADFRERLTTEERDALGPVALPDGRLFYSAYAEGRSNLYQIQKEGVFARTDVSTGLFDASPAPEGVWALLFRHGQRRVVRLTPRDLQHEGVAPQPEAGPPPELERRPLTGAEPYRPFRLSNWQLGPIFGIVGGGTGGIAGQLMGVTRDRLGNHALALNLAVYGSLSLTDGFLLYINQERRITWAVGPFQSLRFRTDATFDDLPFRFTSGERFLGALGSLRYPLDRFSYTQLDLSVGSASYFLLKEERLLLSDPEFNLTGTDLLQPWLDANSGAKLQTEATLLWGYDTLRAEMYSPISGMSLLLDATATVQPVSGSAYGNLRFDAARYFSLGGTASFSLRGAIGTTMGGRLARQYFLSSFDTLRGVPFADQDRLLGRDFLFSTAEFRVPLGSLIQVAFLSELYAVAGLDAGGVGNGWEDALDKRVLDFALGGNVGLGPFIFRLHFARNIDIGAKAGLPVAANEWVTNFSLRLLGADGYLFHQPRGRRSDLR